MSLEKMGLQHLNKTGAELPPEAIEVALKAVTTYKTALISAASSARNRAVSWRSRPFKIGCSVFALNKNLDLSELEMFTGANYKPSPGEGMEWPERKCSEMVAIEEALKEGVKFIPAIVTVSSEKNTSERGTEMHDVVHPCKRCRDFFKELINKGVVSNNTWLINVRDDCSGVIQIQEERRVGDLFALYKEE